MIVEVVTRKIGEHGEVEIQRSHPPLLQTMGRNLHGHGTCACLFQLCQGGLHAQRIRRGMPPGQQFAMETVTQRTDDSAALAEQVQGLGQQLADTGFAIGASDADQAQGAARLAIETPGNRRQLGRQATHRDQRARAVLHRRSTVSLVGHGCSATGNGISDMRPAIRLATRHGQEQVARQNLAAVQGQFTNKHRGLGLRQQLIEWHGHQKRPPLTWASFCGCASAGRLSGAIFIKRSAPAMTLPNTGADTRPP